MADPYVTTLEARHHRTAAIVRLTVTRGEVSGLLNARAGSSPADADPDWQARDLYDLARQLRRDGYDATFDNGEEYPRHPDEPLRGRELA